MNIEEIITLAAQKGASDIHLIHGATPKIRVDGSIIEAGEERVSDDEIIKFADENSACSVSCKNFCGEADFGATVENIRVRVNIFKGMGHFSASIRILHYIIPKLETLSLPPYVAAVADLRRGLFLVTGETGSGKSTTLAAIIDSINHSRQAHVITLEDPVEYIYTPDKCIFNQREVGRDTGGFAQGLRAALREDPDIILIGEMRDIETMETAITAAETGHLVLATLHSGSAADAIDRIVGAFPQEKQQQIRMQLSMTLRAVLSQQLLVKTSGGRIAACEYLLVNKAAANLIREGKTPQINNVIATTAAEGAISMDNSIIRLYKTGKISLQTAKQAAHDLEYFSNSILG